MKKVHNHQQSIPDTKLTPEITATELISRTENCRMSAHKIWIPAFAEYPPHTHPSQHIVIVLEGGGSLRMNINGVPANTTISKGDMFHVPSDTPHQVGADSRGMILMAVSVDSFKLDDPERLKVVDAV